MMPDKIIITELPITKKFLKQKRLIQRRGELALIEDGHNFQHLGYFSLFKGEGYRGGHYHLNKIEHFYVISGILTINLVNLETGHRSNVTLKQGQKAAIRPKCAHRFLAIEDAQVIEYYDGVYEAEDDIPYDFDII